jgi:hypothetical protein
VSLYLPISIFFQRLIRELHRPAGCTIIILAMGSFIALSLFLGLFLTLRKEYGFSMGDSFTLAGYIIGVGTLVCGFMYARHLPSCKCWKARDEEEIWIRLDERSGIQNSDTVSEEENDEVIAVSPDEV